MNLLILDAGHSFDTKGKNNLKENFYEWPLNEAGTIIEFVIKAPLVAKKCLPGQFIVLRLDENGERVP